MTFLPFRDSHRLKRHLATMPVDDFLQKLDELFPPRLQICSRDLSQRCSQLKIDSFSSRAKMGPVIPQLLIPFTSSKEFQETRKNINPVIKSKQRTRIISPWRIKIGLVFFLNMYIDGHCPPQLIVIILVHQGLC